MMYSMSEYHGTMVKAKAGVVAYLEVDFRGAHTMCAYECGARVSPARILCNVRGSDSGSGGALDLIQSILVCLPIH